MIIVSVCVLKKRIDDSRVIAKKIIVSFFAGVFIALSYTLSGLSNRNVMMAGLGSDGSWSPIIIVFLVTSILLNAIFYKLIHG